MEIFVEELVRELQKRIGDKYHMRVNEILKVNDVKLLSINFLGKNRRVSPNVYLESCYEKYNNGCSMDKIVDEIIETIETIENEGDVFANENLMIESLLNYDKVRGNIMVKVVNAETNKEYLKDKVYKKCNDFAMVFYVLVEQDDKGMLSTAVTKKLVEIWGVDDSVLLDNALSNMHESLPVRIEKLESIIMDLVEDLGIELELPTEEVEKWKTENVYIMTNEIKLEGATTIFYEGVLKQFALEHNVEEVIIIPSSVHEVLLIPKNGSEWIDEEMCKEMLRDVNNTEVNPTEILSYNVYIYNCKTDEITIWKED